MVGSNLMELNEATMKEIVQYWLDNKFVSKDLPVPEVTSVKATTFNSCTTFEVRMESPAKAAA